MARENWKNSIEGQNQAPMRPILKEWHIWWLSHTHCMTLFRDTQAKRVLGIQSKRKGRSQQSWQSNSAADLRFCFSRLCRNEN